MLKRRQADATTGSNGAGSINQHDDNGYQQQQQPLPGASGALHPHTHGDNKSSKTIKQRIHFLTNKSRTNASLISFIVMISISVIMLGLAITRHGETIDQRLHNNKVSSIAGTGTGDSSSSNTRQGSVPTRPPPSGRNEPKIPSSSLSSAAASSEQRQSQHRLQQQQPQLGKAKIVDETSPTIAYAISMVKCSDHRNSIAGLIDAALVLRHSIDRIHARSARYKRYQMYAIVHDQAQACSAILEKVGFAVVVRKPPLARSEIRGDFLRTHIARERCCGHDEFIKLYAYDLPNPIIVHTDIDVVFFKPMDLLFDAILYDAKHPIGAAARQQIPLEFPDHGYLADTIDTFITRDWFSVIPGRKSVYQAGFLVTRRLPITINETVDIVKEGNYVEGFGRDNGWYGLGYGGSVGSMAMQGLMAYYYDHVRNLTVVELDQCQFNHMGMTVQTPSGQCRTMKSTCEDCRTTPIDNIYNVHYTACRKPWTCVGTSSENGKKDNVGPRETAIDTRIASLEHCMAVVQRWHEIRSDFENQLFAKTQHATIKQGRIGTYQPEIFHGHCSGDGTSGYIPISIMGDNDAKSSENDRIFSSIASLYR